MLITPEILSNILGKKEYASFITQMFPSVPERTLRNVFKGKTNPQKKTREKMIQDVCKRIGLSRNVILKIISPGSFHPWKTVFTGFERGAKNRFPKTMRYAFEIIIRIEDATFQAGNAKQRGDPHWFNCFKRAGLPLAILPEQFFDAYLYHGAGTVNKRGEEFVPAISGEVFLRTSLYCLAACEVAFMNSEEENLKIGLWIHKALPNYDGEKLISPMRHVFLGMMKYYDKSNVETFAKVLPCLSNDDPDPDNQKRVLLRWMKGEVPPSWKNMFLIRDKLFDGDSDLLINYGVARFLQNIFNDLRDHAVPKYFKDEKKIVSIFQEYPAWQDLHQKGFSEWSEARNRSCSSLRSIAYE